EHIGEPANANHVVAGLRRARPVQRPVPTQEEEQQRPASSGGFSGRSKSVRPCPWRLPDTPDRPRRTLWVIRSHFARTGGQKVEGSGTSPPSAARTPI